MCNRKRRRSFVLIEVLVATSLFVLMLVCIFGIFWRTTKTNDSINKLRKANEQMLVAQAKLQNAFANAIFEKKYRPYFFVETDRNSNLPSLIFTIDNTQQPIPELSGIVLLKLYIEDNQLVLATFPHIEVEMPEIMEKETLLANVSDLKMEFFLAPSSQKAAEENEETTKRPPEAIWTDNWPKEYATAPTLVKLHVTKAKGGTFTLWFFIPDMINAVLYDKA